MKDMSAKSNEYDVDSLECKGPGRYAHELNDGSFPDMIERKGDNKTTNTIRSIEWLKVMTSIRVWAITLDEGGLRLLTSGRLLGVLMGTWTRKDFYLHHLVTRDRLYGYWHGRAGVVRAFFLLPKELRHDTPILFSLRVLLMDATI